MTGFGTQSKGAELLVNQPATINFALSVQESKTTVEVSTEAQTINATDATIGNSVSNTTVQALPMEGRNVPDLLSLTVVLDSKTESAKLIVAGWFTSNS